MIGQPSTGGAVTQRAHFLQENDRWILPASTGQASKGFLRPHHVHACVPKSAQHAVGSWLLGEKLLRKGQGPKLMTKCGTERQLIGALQQPSGILWRRIGPLNR
jgi:hypothetical protein